MAGPDNTAEAPPWGIGPAGDMRGDENVRYGDAGGATEVEGFLAATPGDGVKAEAAAAAMAAPTRLAPSGLPRTGVLLEDDERGACG